MLLRGLLPGELALSIYQAVEPGHARIAFGRATRVNVPVEGFAVVAEAAVELPDEVGGDGEIAPDEVVLLQGAHEVAHGPQLEGALEGTLLLLAADPGGAQAQVAQLAGLQAPFLAADLGRVEAEPRRLALAEDLEQAVLLKAFLYAIAFVEGQVELVEGLAGRERTHRAHGYGAPDQTRPVRGAAWDLGAEIGLPADGNVGAGVSDPERVAADGADDVRSARLTHRRPSPLAGRRAALVSPFWGLGLGSKRPRFYHSGVPRRYNPLRRPAQREASVWSSARARPRSPWS